MIFLYSAYNILKYLTCTLYFPLGQCTNYKLQSNQYKRSSGYQLATDDVAISDNFLSEGWYRFKSGAGNDMVTSAPSLTKCGTIYPVWLNGMWSFINLIKSSNKYFLRVRILISDKCRKALSKYFSKNGHFKSFNSYENLFWKRNIKLVKKIIIYVQIKNILRYFRTGENFLATRYNLNIYLARFIVDSNKNTPWVRREFNKESRFYMYKGILLYQRKYFKIPLKS